MYDAGQIYVATIFIVIKITRLHEFSEYSFRVTSENRIGMSTPAQTQSVVVKLPFGKN